MKCSTTDHLPWYSSTNNKCTMVVKTFKHITWGTFVWNKRWTSKTKKCFTCEIRMQENLASFLWEFWQELKIYFLHNKTLYQGLLIQEPLYFKRTTVSYKSYLKTQLPHDCQNISHYPHLGNSSLYWNCTLPLSHGRCCLMSWYTENKIVTMFSTIRRMNQKKNVRIIWKNNRPCTTVSSTHSRINASIGYIMDNQEVEDVDITFFIQNALWHYLLKLWGKVITHSVLYTIRCSLTHTDSLQSALPLVHSLCQSKFFGESKPVLFL